MLPRTALPFLFLSLAIHGCSLSDIDEGDAPTNMSAEACNPAAGGITEIIERHSEALGGRAAIESVESLEIELHIVEPDFTVTGVYRATRDGRMRVDIFMSGERVFTEAFDGESGWQMAGGQTTGEVMRAETAAILKRGIYDKFFGWYDYERLGLSLEYSGQELIGGQCFDAVKLDYNDGMTTYLYLNAETGRIELTRDFSALHPDIDPEKRRNESAYFDFREVDGHVRSFREIKTDVETGEIIQTMTITKLTQNLAFDPSVFVRPVEN